MFGVFPFGNPETLRDYFQTEEEWEDYCRRWQEWMQQLDEGPEDPHVIQKKPRHTFRCRGCGKYMSTFKAHIATGYGNWHMNAKCLKKLRLTLEKNPTFSWTKPRYF
jgi:hypothetical protein